MRRAVLTTIAVAVFGGYVVSNQLLQGRPAAVLDTPVDHAIPFVPAAEFVYISVYLFLFLPVAQIRHMAVFERVAYAFYTYNSLSLLVFYLFPVRFERPDFEITSVTTWGVAFNYAYDPPYNNFPSLHVANSVWAALIAWRLDPPIGRIAAAIAASIAVSTTLVKQHWLADVLAGCLVGWAAYFFIVRPAVPEGATREELCFPRRYLLILVAIYAAAMLFFVVAYHVGWQPFPWPLGRIAMGRG